MFVSRCSSFLDYISQLIPSNPEATSIASLKVESRYAPAGNGGHNYFSIAVGLDTTYRLY
jgi:hypothetical protein